jgi:hypothetical protein
MKTVLALCTSSLLLLAPAASATSLLVNGTFETGTMVGWTPQPATLPGGGTLMDVQTANNRCGQGFEFPLACQGPHSGAWDMAFGGNMNLFDSRGLEDVLSQAVATVPGQLYTLDFWMAQDSPGLACCYNEFRVFWNGTPVLTTRNLPHGDYLNYQLSLWATGESSTLGFGSMNLPGWNRLDDVSLTAVEMPESASLGLLALGLVPLACTGYRRRYGVQRSGKVAGSSTL